MIQETAGTSRSPGYAHIREDLRQRVSLVCFFRLILLVLLILPLTLSSTGEATTFLKIVREGHYIAFLVVGFALTLFFLLSWKRFSDILFFFRLQLVADFCLCLYLLFITGGITSYFFFLFLGVIFLYGRLLGFETAKRISWATGILVCALALLQYLQPIELLCPCPPLGLKQTLYYLGMQLLSILLINSLLRMGYANERRLLHELDHKQRQLQRSEQLKSKVFDWMASGLLVVDPHGSVSVINQSALELAGIDDYPAALGTSLRDLFPSLADLWQEWDKSSHYRTETNTDSLTLGATLAPLPEEMGSLLLFSDITQIKALQEQVKQMEKMAGLGELAAGLAHELKNPLAGIKASLQLLRQDRIPSDQQARLHNVVQKDIERMDNLVKEFLAFARPAEAVPEFTEIGNVLRGCLDNLGHLHPEVHFEIDPSLDGVRWFWDPEQLQQILMNLLLNAAQACDGTADPTVRISLGRDPNGQYLAITDNGQGLDREKRKDIFDPFVTTKKNGSGLGLSIALRLAKQNGSRLALHNSTAQGAEARLYAPSEGKQQAKET